jgi:hypothetical protein
VQSVNTVMCFFIANVVMCYSVLFIVLILEAIVCRMATDKSGLASLTATAAVPVILKRNSDDVGWEYGVLVDPLNKEKVRCLLCGHCSS